MYEGQQEDSRSQPLRLEGARQGLTPKTLRNPMGLRQQEVKHGSQLDCRARRLQAAGPPGAVRLTDGMERAQQARHVAPGPAPREAMSTDVDT